MGFLGNTNLLTLSVAVSLMFAGPLKAPQANERPVIGGYSIPFSGGIYEMPQNGGKL